MAINAISAVWKHSRHDGTHLLLMLAIADNASEDAFTAYPKVETLAQKVRLSVRRTQELLQELATDTDDHPAELKLDINGGPKRCNLYTILLPGVEEPRENSHPAKTRTLRKLAQDPANSRAKTPRILAPSEQKESPSPAGADGHFAKQIRHRTVIDPSIEDGEAINAPKTEPTRIRNLHWDALVEGIGHPCPPGQDKAWGKAIIQLKGLDATPAEIVHRCQVWRVKFSELTLTPQALVKFWYDLAQMPQTVPRAIANGAHVAPAQRMPLATGPKRPDYRSKENLP